MDDYEERLREFCRENGIRHPYVFLNRKKSDNLSQSIKCDSTKDAELLGVRLFRVYNFDRLHIVDKGEFDRQITLFEKAFEDRKNCLALEEILRASNSNVRKYVSYLRDGCDDTAKQIVEKFIRIRKERAIIKYVYEIFQRYLTNNLLTILDRSISKEDRKNSDGYYRLIEQKYAFASTRELLETKSYNEYCGLVEIYSEEEFESEEFRRRFDGFFEEYCNLNLRKINEMPLSKQNLLDKIRQEKRFLMRIRHNAKGIMENKRDLIIHMYYGLPEGERPKIHYFRFLMERVDNVVYEESWGRQDWTRLNLAVQPYFLEIDRFLREVGFLASTQEISDLEINQLNIGLRLIEN